MSAVNGGKIVTGFYIVYILYLIYSTVRSIMTIRRLRKQFEQYGQNQNWKHDYSSQSKQRWEKAAKTFGVSVEELKKMPKDKIKKMYRERAKRAHPDTGGSDQAFQNLNQDYEWAFAGLIKLF